MAIQIEKPAFAHETPIISEIFDILNNFLLDPSPDCAPCANKLTELFTPFLDTFERTDAVGYLWGTLFWIVKQVPPSHEYQVRLVSLVLSIRDVEPPAGKGPDAYEEVTGERFWTGLPFVRKMWADYEDKAPLVPPMDERPDSFPKTESMTSPGPWLTRLTGQDWTNLQAFSARLHASSDLPFLDLRGLFALLEALEREQDAATLDNLVPAAACWILYAGSKLRNNSIPYPPYDFEDHVKRVPWSVGELYHGKKGFNAERWEFWWLRFGIMKDCEDLKVETRQWAEEAQRKMAEI
jgi:hypothetical protein